MLCNLSNKYEIPSNIEYNIAISRSCLNGAPKERNSAIWVEPSTYRSARRNREIAVVFSAVNKERKRHCEQRPRFCVSKIGGVWRRDFAIWIFFCQGFLYTKEKLVFSCFATYQINTKSRVISNTTSAIWRSCLNEIRQFGKPKCNEVSFKSPLYDPTIPKELFCDIWDRRVQRGKDLRSKSAESFRVLRGC